MAVACTWNTCSGVQLVMSSLLGEPIAHTWVTCFHPLLIPMKIPSTLHNGTSLGGAASECTVFRHSTKERIKWLLVMNYICNYAFMPSPTK